MRARIADTIIRTGAIPANVAAIARVSHTRAVLGADRVVGTTAGRRPLEWSCHARYRARRRTPIAASPTDRQAGRRCAPARVDR